MLLHSVDFTATQVCITTLIIWNSVVVNCFTKPCQVCCHYYFSRENSFSFDTLPNSSCHSLENKCIKFLRLFYMKQRFWQKWLLFFCQTMWWWHLIWNSITFRVYEYNYFIKHSNTISYKVTLCNNTSYCKSLSLGLCLCDFVLHKYWKRKLRSTQVASHGRGPHHHCSGGGWRSLRSLSQSTRDKPFIGTWSPPPHHAPSPLSPFPWSLIGCTWSLWTLNPAIINTSFRSSATATLFTQKYCCKQDFKATLLLHEISGLTICLRNMLKKKVLKSNNSPQAYLSCT